MIRQLTNLRTKCSADSCKMFRLGFSPAGNKRTQMTKRVQSNYLNLNHFSFSSVAKDNIFISINTNVKQDENTAIETEKLLNPMHESIDSSSDKTTMNAADVDNDANPNVDEDGMEQEDMFVEADPSLGHSTVEWGGPRRGGRFSEPTRFGDWERKGRCTDF